VVTEGERRVNLVATLQRLLAVLDRAPVPADFALAEEWSRARAEAHAVLRLETQRLPGPPPG
jgi:hypothetical protein